MTFLYGDCVLNSEKWYLDCDYLPFGKCYLPMQNQSNRFSHMAVGLKSYISNLAVILRTVILSLSCYLTNSLHPAQFNEEKNEKDYLLFRAESQNSKSCTFLEYKSNCLNKTRVYNALLNVYVFVTLYSFSFAS